VRVVPAGWRISRRRLAAAARSSRIGGVRALFSHHFPLDRAAEAIEFAMRRPPDAIKVMVTVGNTAD
jgi:threonine dehydrogenase-like Zn-dependent dehydrogenase